MTYPDQPQPGDVLTTAEAAGLLAADLGGAVDYWRTWLKNDRKPTRQQLLPPLPGPGRPRYMRAAIDALVGSERRKRLATGQPVSRAAEVMKAFGIGDGGTSTGRPLDAHVSGQLDETSRQGFVQLHITNPLLVYRLSLQEARDMAAKLTSEAADAENLQTRAQEGAA